MSIDDHEAGMEESFMRSTLSRSRTRSAGSSECTSPSSSDSIISYAHILADAL